MKGHAEEHSALSDGGLAIGGDLSCDEQLLAGECL
jgi:hypothetical protein